MAILSVKFLGGFELIYGGKPVRSLKTQKSRGLFAYLCMHPNKSFSRVSLATLFWPEQAVEKSSHSLRQALSVLRKNIPNGREIIQTDRFQVSFVLNDAVSSDVARFEELSLDQKRLEDAIDEYTGRFLEGFYIDGSAEFETWVLSKREQLQATALSLLEQIAESKVSQDDYAGAKTYLNRIVDLDPLHELAYQNLMLIDARQGNFNRAIASFQKLKSLLAEELGVEPIRSSIALLEKIEAAKQTPPSNKLPYLGEGLIGRETEVGQVLQLLSLPQTRLVTIIGPGGVGKSSLAQHVAYQKKRTFLNGVVFVSLAPLSDHRLIPREIAKAVGFTSPHNQGFEPALLSFLANREMLLVLDNFEHVLKGAAFVSSVLQEAADISILATSREPLNLHQEQRFRLKGLPFLVDNDNNESSLFEDAQKLGSYQLFVARAQRINPTFPVESGIDQILKICQLLEGMPLGLELAAVQLESQSLLEISNEISKNFDALEKDWVDRPDRHRSLKAVFLHSLDQLTPQLQRALGCLAVFRGGFDSVSARQVGASRHEISQLMSKSLVRQISESGRFDMHPVVQQYAAEEIDSHIIATARANHLIYFLNLLKEAQEKGGYAADVLEETNRRLGLELGNIRIAWRMAVNEKNLLGLAGALTGMSKLYAGQSWFREGADLFNWTIEQLQAVFTEDRPSREKFFWGHLHGYASGMSLYLSEIGQAKLMSERSIHILEPLNATDELGYAWNMFGISQIYSGQFPAAIEALEKSIQCYRQTENIGQMLGPLVNLGSVYQRVGDYEQGLDSLKEGFEISQTIKDRRGSAHLLNNIGGILFTLGRLDEAVDYFERCLILCEEMDYPMVQASALFNLAEISLKTKPFKDEQIQHWLDTGLSISKKIEDRQKVARGHKLTADYQMAKGQYDEAWHVLIESLSLVWNVKALPSVLEVLMGVAKHATETGRLDLAQNTIALIATHAGAPQHIKKQAIELREQHRILEVEPSELEELIELIL